MTGPRALIKPNGLLGFDVGIEGIDRTRAFLSGAAQALPVAVATGLNRTAEEAMAAVRRRMQQNFIIRVPQFLPPLSLPRDDRATADRLFASVTLYDAERPLPVGRAPGGEALAQRRGAILSKFEEGGIKRAGSLGFVALPTKRLRRDPRQRIPGQLYPVNLGLVVSRRDASGERIAPRSERTLGRSKRLTAQGLAGRTYFAAPLRNGMPGIFERVTDRRNGANRAVPPRLIWAFRSEVRIPQRLEFFATARGVIEQRLQVNVEGALLRYQQFAATR